ncbi:MAG TPA: cysteine desulfurase family protein [Pirellulales bacterium]|jgi:cysteine desulfurase|nr:cysteine desulfurase family protein [Pirellulales bacterium]
MQPIYLDHNATTPLLPEVADAMAECQSAGFANPESQHQLGRRARQLLEDAREGIAENLGADLSGREPDRLIFTSGGTEANNLALFGLTGALSAAPARIIISSIEHPSISQPAEFLSRRGWHLNRLPVSRDGVCEKGDILLFKTGPTAARSNSEKSGMSPFFPLVASVMLANNETGVIQPIRELAALAHAAGVPLHTDAVQAVGKVPVHFRELGVAAMTVAAHKFHGPRGIGALILHGGVQLNPLLFGGFQQQGLRPGTEPVTLAVGMHAALRIFAREQTDRCERMTLLRDRLEQSLLTAWPSAVIHGAAAPRLPNTTCIAFPGLDRQALVMALDLAGVACSTGSACASGSSEPSPTLVAMGLSDELVGSSIRFSLGATTTTEMIDEAIDRISNVLEGFRCRSPRDRL